MKRQAIRGLLMFGMLALVLSSAARAQTVLDSVTVRDRKDGSTKTYSGTFTLTPAGFQVVGADKKVVATVAPDDVVKFSVGDLPGVDRADIRTATAKEDKKDYEGARTIYTEQLKKTGLQERSRRYLEFKKVMMTNKIVDELDEAKGWAEKADECIKDWNAFLASEDTKFGWEQWPAVRACTRLEIERHKFDDASRAWGRVAKNKNMPPEAQAEAALQEIDLQVRSKQYALAATFAAELAKSAAGARKERLAIYEIAAKAAGEGKPAEGIDKIKAEMNKSKDPSVHATGFSMMGELALAAGKSRDAMWNFLWVETVLNQDKDEALKAMSRLAEIFEAQMDEDQVKKYREKIKRFRTSL
jgi:hypothetical protein